MDSISKYLRDTLAEMRQVAWPTQSETLRYTLLVVGISAFVALFVAAFDYLFSQGIQIIVSSF